MIAERARVRYGVLHRVNGEADESLNSGDATAAHR
jgi:hypothetical protein